MVSESTGEAVQTPGREEEGNPETTVTVLREEGAGWVGFALFSAAGTEKASPGSMQHS